jgi:hypothetical protein
MARACFSRQVCSFWASDWRAHEARLAELAGKLAAAQQPAPAAVLRSLNDIDGDFELQAPAAGGSNGVLVPPWHYRGNIAVTFTRVKCVDSDKLD